MPEHFDFNPHDNLRFDPELNLRWFDETPGFDELYGTMSDILTPDENGKHISAEEALAMWKQAEESVAARYKLTKQEASLMGTVAFKSARILPTELELEISDTGNYYE